MKILLCYGTRPELIKILPLISAFKNRIEYKVLFTGQHQTLVALEKDVPRDLELFITSESTNGNRLDHIFSSVLSVQDLVFEGISHVLVQGDTASALALSMAAFHRNIPVIHLEAGLRTYDLKNPYPEEYYRQSISRLACIHLCPTASAADNLHNERAQGELCVTGNTVVDGLRNYKTNNYSNRVLITLHRRENHSKIKEWFKALNEVAKENPSLEFVFPAHPNPAVQSALTDLKGIQIQNPLPYDEFIKELANCRFAISDSGGIQEEASYLGRKVIVCRKVTERTEGIGTHAFLCAEPQHLADLVRQVRDDYILNEPCPYGDGHAAERITCILEALAEESNSNTSTNPRDEQVTQS